MRRLIPIIFPIGAVWLCAWLNETITATDGYFIYHRIGFMSTSWGFALIVTIICIEIALIYLFGDY